MFILYSYQIYWLKLLILFHIIILVYAGSSWCPFLYSWLWLFLSSFFFLISLLRVSSTLLIIAENQFLTSLAFLYFYFIFHWLCKLLRNYEKGILPNLFHEGSSTPITKPDNNTVRKNKLWTNSPYEQTQRSLTKC